MLLLNYVFETCINISIKGSILIVLILAFQQFFRRNFTERWTYALWLLAVVRFIIPFSIFKSPISLYGMGLINKMKFTINDVLLGNLATSGNDFLMIGRAVKVDEFVSNAFKVSLKSVLSAVWVVGMLIMLIIFIAILIRVNHLIKNSIKCTDGELLNILNKYKVKLKMRKLPEIYISSDIATPMVIGIVLPKIIIPQNINANIEKKNLEYIILHEMLHIKRFDMLFNYIASVILIINWFNPLVWVAIHRSKKDCELACDESVLAVLDNEDYLRYGRTLVNVLELMTFSNSYDYIMSKPLMYDRSEANARITRISEYHNKSKAIIKVSICIILLLVLLGFNDPNSARPNNTSVKHDLSYYLQVSEKNIRKELGIKPIHTYFLNTERSPYFILYYSTLGNKIQFWFDGTRGDDGRRAIEVTATSYKGISQGMHIAKALEAAQAQYGAMKDIQETASLNTYIYKDTDLTVTIISDKISNKVYSISLTKEKSHET